MILLTIPKTGICTCPAGKTALSEWTELHPQRLLMLKNVDESAERVLDIEPADAPWLTGRPMLHRNFASLYAIQCLVKIIHFYG